MNGVPGLQLWEGFALRQGMLPAKAGQLTSYSSTYGYAVEEPAEGPNIVFWPHQLHHHGGDIHGRGSSYGYVLPQ
jgi:hypothetical protein